MSSRATLALVVFLSSVAGVGVSSAANSSESTRSDAITLPLHPTGMSEDGNLLAEGAVDPHYQLIQSPDPDFPGPEARVALSTGWPFPQWAGNGPDSEWISPRSDVVEGNAGGTYIYRTIVDLSGLDPASAVVTGQWATDNDGLDILINGTSTGNRNFQGFSFGSFAPFAVTNGFVNGTNTLDFVVHQAGTGTPTGLRVELRGTAMLPCTNCGPSTLPVLSITSPADRGILCPGSDLSVHVEALALSGRIDRVQLFVGTTLLGERTSLPYEFTLDRLPVGDYVLSAKAIDWQGASTISEPVHVVLTQSCPDRVGIVASSTDAAVAPLQAALFEIGVDGIVIDPANFHRDTIRGLKALVWLSSSETDALMTGSTLALLQEAAAQGTGLYFTGQHLAGTLMVLDDLDRRAWAEFLHLQPDATSGGDSWIYLRRDVPVHPIVEGIFGAGPVDDFPSASSGGSVAPDANVLGTSGAFDVLAAFPRVENAPSGQARIVTQFFDAWSGVDETSWRERRKLFINSIDWLLRWSPCSTYSLSLEFDAPKRVVQGGAFTCTFRVQHQGECEATGVVVTNQLPSQLRFLGADFTQGSFDEQNGLVIFRVGHLGSAAAAVLNMQVLALQSGIVTNCATAEGNGEPVGGASTACQVIQLAAGDDPSPHLRCQRTAEGGIQLELNGAAGLHYAIEGSADLSGWTSLTNVILTAPTFIWKDAGVLSRRFYRAARIDLP